MLRLRSYAKLNLFLDIAGKEGHLHRLHMLMQSISLYDELVFEPILEKKLVIECEVPSLAQDNIMSKAFELLAQQYPREVQHGFKVTLRTNIPQAAGLGGGTGNAAALIGVCKRYFGLQMSRTELSEFNLAIGSDVNFCYVGGTQRVEGVGDRLTPSTTPHQYFLVVYPRIHVSTKEAFRLWDIQMTGHRPLPWPEASTTPFNAFEKMMIPMYPEIGVLKEKLLSLGASAVSTVRLVGSDDSPVSIAGFSLNVLMNA